MKEMIINGIDVSKGRVVTALNAMLNGDNSLVRKWDEQFYYIKGECTGVTYLIKREFNCLIIWITYGNPTSFNDGDEFVQQHYHPLCIIDKQKSDEYQDVCRDIANGLIRLRLLNADDYIGPKEA